METLNLNSVLVNKVCVLVKGLEEAEHAGLGARATAHREEGLHGLGGSIWGKECLNTKHVNK